MEDGVRLALLTLLRASEPDIRTVIKSTITQA